MASYITATDLRSSIGDDKWSEIFGDSEGVVDDEQRDVQLILSRSYARVASWLRTIYGTLPDVLPDEVPALLVDAQLDYATALAYERHPEYVRIDMKTIRASFYDRAERTMQNIASSVQRLTDVAPEPAPANVGAIITVSGPRLMTISSTGENLGGDF